MKFAEIIPALEAGHAVRREDWPTETFLQPTEETGSLRMHRAGGDRNPDWQPRLYDIVSDDWLRMDGLDAVAADAIVSQAHMLRMLSDVASEIERALDNPGAQCSVVLKTKQPGAREIFSAILASSTHAIRTLGMEVRYEDVVHDAGVAHLRMSFLWKGDKPTMDGSR